MRPRSRRFWYGLISFLVMVGGLGATGSPYHLIGPGPVVVAGRPAHGSWSVTTVRVRDSTWFQWARSELTGGRSARGGGGPYPSSVDAAMGTSQTYAALVAAQIAAHRVPLGTAGLQVSATPDRARGTRLRTGDVLLAAGADLAPLRSPTDLQAATAGRTSVPVLVVPKTAGDTWGAARVERLSAARLASVPAGPAVSAFAYPLGAVQGSSAGLMLALARIDALTSRALTGGRHVAGTGAIGLGGAVTGVGEIAEKVHGADAAGADVFFVPAPQRADADRAARGTGVRIVPVRSVLEAVGWLCATGGRSPIC